MTTPLYGANVGPREPLQDMAQVDVLAGDPNSDRDRSPASYGGGVGDSPALTGRAIPAEPQTVNPGGQADVG